MRLARYLLPQLTFLIIMFLAWTTINSAKSNFASLVYSNTSTAAAQPTMLVSSGKQNYKFQDNSYELDFAALEIFADDNYRAEQPNIRGEYLGGTGDIDYALTGDMLETAEAASLLNVRGAASTPARLNLAGSDAQLDARSERIDYDTEKVTMLLHGGEGPASRATLIYSTSGETINFSSRVARLDIRTNTHHLQGKVRMEHSRRGARVIGTAQDASFALGGEVRLFGGAEVGDGRGGIKAQEIFYNTTRGTWRISSDPQDEVEIIIPRQ